MRIGINLLYLIPGEVGGTETYARGLLNALARVDVKNEYFIFINRESRHLDFIRHPTFTIVECGVRAVNRPARFVWEQGFLPGQVRRTGIEVLHSLGYVAPFCEPCRSVVTVHDLNFLFVPQSMTGLTRLVQGFSVRTAVRRTDYVIAVSEYVRQQLIQRLRIPAGRITAIHEAAELPVAPAHRPDPAFLSRYGLSRPYILAFSSLTPHKNIPSLIKAFQKITQQVPGTYQLAIIGHEPTSGPSLRKIVQELGLGEQVVFTGYLERPDVNVLLRGAAVFAFPSLYEGFGLPVLEAMANRAPVACSQRGALLEIAAQAAAYFDPADIDQMADVLLKVLRDEALRRTLIQRGIENLGRFSWEDTARQTLAVYARLGEMGFPIRDA